MLLTMPAVVTAQVVEPPKVPITDIQARLRVGAGFSRVWDEGVVENQWSISLPISYGLTKHIGVAYTPSFEYRSQFNDGKFRQVLGVRYVLYGGN